MPEPLHLGNDIVALTSPRCRGKAADSRFLNRVFSSGEREAISASPVPETALWLRWAGKEAIYKSATKVLGSAPTFQHELFRVSFSGNSSLDPASSLLLLGTGSYQALSFQIQAELRPHYVHAVAWESSTGPEANERLEWRADKWSGEAEVIEDEFRNHFSPEELDCISHRTSALTRMSARRALASVLSLDESRLEVRCGPGAPGRRVPLVFLDGRKAPLDLTLSHDANLMAWAFLRPE
jgi:hypothetical protein